MEWYDDFRTTRQHMWHLRMHKWGATTNDRRRRAYSRGSSKTRPKNSFLTGDSDATTLLGEFFDIALFQQFLQHNQHALCTLLQINELRIRIVPFGEFHGATFYIVPGIRPRKWYESKKMLSCIGLP